MHRALGTFRRRCTDLASLVVHHMRNIPVGAQKIAPFSVPIGTPKKLRFTFLNILGIGE